VNIGFLVTFPDPKDPDTSKGGYRYVTGLIKLLSEKNKITLFTISERKWSLDSPFYDNIVYLRSPHQLIRWIKTTQALVKHRKMLDLLIAYNPSIAALPVLLLRILFSDPIVIIYMDRQTTPSSSGRKILRLLGWFSERLFLLTINNWLVNSIELGDFVRKIRKKSNIILYRTMVSLVPSGEETKSLPVEVEANRINICYSGLIYHDSGTDILIDSFTELPSDNVHLYITGFGPMKPMLEDRVREENLSNITILFLENEVMDDFLSRMDILVVPYRDTKETRRASFPSKVFGYMGAGKAIIATSVGELPQVLENGKTAVLIEPDNREALREALTELITSAEKREELGLNARKYFDDNFSEEVVKPKITEYLTNIINLNK